MNNELIGKINGSVEELNALLLSMRGISPIREKMLYMLDSLQEEPRLGDDAKKVLYLYFSLMEDGNTRISLDSKTLLEKWSIKWNGLVAQAKTKDEINGVKDSQYFESKDFATVIKNGCKDLSSKKYASIIGENGKPLILKTSGKQKHLYTNKFFEAKTIIENQINSVFKSGNDQGKATISEEDVKALSGFTVEAEQLEAINRGQHENLIITGGPGTGKTTVVLYILWFLLKNNPELINQHIYLAAPSGKAADRMQESVMDNLNKLNKKVIAESDVNQSIYSKLIDLDSSTLHRMLCYNVGSGKFAYNGKNKFPDHSIFVIDEASMIDISMFAAFLQAVPETAHVFILGDVDQLPSVDAGAVLGELLNANRSYKVTLKTSRRFTATSEIGKLARKLQTKQPLEQQFGSMKKSPDYWTDAFVTGNNAPNFVEFIQMEKDDDGKKLTKKQESEKISSLLSVWVKDLYHKDGLSISELAQKVNPTKTAAGEINSEEQQNRNILWELTLSARILAAQRSGNRGVEELNKTISKLICGKDKDIPSDGTYFAGQLLILTQNQNMYKLYNGDTGVVVFHKGRPYLMLKKNGQFTFTSLSILPADSIEPAFAITIHKSQGSEYNHILMLLPTNVGHPLLTNQIVYTGITRAKQTVTLIASYETFKSASATITVRDTGIEL